MNAFAFAYPAAAWLALVPLVVWIVARRRAESSVRESGARRLLESVAAERVASIRRGGVRTPAWWWLAAAGASSLALALAGPRIPVLAADAALDVHVVRDAALALGAERADGRLARGIAAVHALAAALDPVPGGLVWSAEDRAPLRTALDGAPPREWFTARPFPESPSGAPDRGDAVWLAARAVEPAPRLAGLVAPGGSAEPGPVAWDAEGVLVLDADGALARAPHRATPRVAIDEGPPFDGPLGDAVRAWVGARGLSLDGDGELVLHFRAAAAPDFTGRSRIGRDGWQASVEPLEGGARGTAPRGTPFVALAPDSVLVAASPGVVEAARVAWSEPSGDGAWFALSFAALFDSVANPPAAVAPLAARDSQGPAVTSPPRWEQRAGAREPATWPTAVAAALGASLALLAVLFERRGAPRRHQTASPLSPSGSPSMRP